MIIKQRKLRKIDDEIWLEVPNSNNRYHISNYGRIKSFSYNKTDGQILKLSEVNGFKHIQLYLNKVSLRYYVHKLVAEIWIPKPSDLHTYVAHLDGNSKNNSVSNLEWHTKETLMEKHRELIMFKYKDTQRPKPINNSKLKERDIILLKSMLQRGIVQAKIAKMFCISEMQVTRIKRGENWGHI
jgi:DNA-directed RNA polymerase specialized sigma subunit